MTSGDGFEIPRDGPAAALARVAELLSLPQPRDQIARAVAAHPRPTSILALIDVAGQIGWTAKAVKGTEAGLRAQSFPLIAHFSDEHGGGFGVVEEASEEGFLVWDDAHGSRVVDAATFSAAWSGVLVLLDRDHSADRTKKGRSGALISRSESPSLTGGPSAPLWRAALAAIIGLQIVLSISEISPGERAAWGAVTLLCVAGLGLTIRMTVALTDYRGPFAPSICRRSRLIDCDGVLRSPAARILGFRLSDLGAAYYLSVLLMIAIGRGPAVQVVISWSFALSVLVAVILIGVQVFMRKFCSMCLVVHALNLGAAVLAITAMPAIPATTDLVRTSLLFALLFSGALLVIIPFFLRSKTLERVSEDHARMLSSPLSGLAQLATEDPTGLVPERIGIRLGSSDDQGHLVAFIHPSCKQCEALLRELSSVIATAKMNVYVSVPPRNEDEERLCAAIVSAGLARGPQFLLAAFASAKEKPAGLSEDPFGTLASHLSVPRSEIEAHRRQAEAVVREAADFAARYVEGTPTVFVNGLPFRGPMSNLVTLLDEHADLLPRPASETL